jgi:hypothetical protein
LKCGTDGGQILDILRVMRIETKENQIVLKEVYNSITLETKEGKQLHICMRGYGYEMNLDVYRWVM